MRSLVLLACLCAVLVVALPTPTEAACGGASARRGVSAKQPVRKLFQRLFHRQ